MLGSEVQLEIVLTNTSGAALTNLVINDRFDEGLQIADAAVHRDMERRKTSGVSKNLDRLAAGESLPIYLKLRVTKLGPLCHTVEVKQNGRVLANAKRCRWW